MNKLKIYLIKEYFKKTYKEIKKYIPILIILLTILILKLSINNIITNIINLLLTLLILKLINYKKDSKLTKHDIYTSKVIMYIFILYLYLGLIFGFNINSIYYNLNELIPNIINYSFIIPITYLLQYIFYKEYKKNNILILIISIIYYLLFINNINLIPFIIILEIIKLIDIKNKELKGYILEPLLLLTIFILPIKVNINIELFQNLIILILLILTIYYKKIIKINIPYKNIIIKIFILITIILFLSNTFKYNIVVISSDSMGNTIQKSSVAIVEKLSIKEERHTLKKDEIVLYKKNNNKILHRIVKVDNTSSIYTKYILKGDNNKDNDMLSVSEEDIQAKYLFNIPLIGLPIVLIENILDR